MTPEKIWVKICANTSLEDALLAAGVPADRSSSAGFEAGADAVGFVFAPSPRRVTVSQVAAIVPHLPASLETIGVFVDATFGEIEATVRACNLTGVQLHFEAAPDLPARLRQRFGPGLRILRVLHFDAGHATQAPAPVSGRDFIADAKSQPEPLEVSGHDFSRAATSAKAARALAPESCLSDPNIDAVLVDSRTASTVGGTGQSFDWNLAAKTVFQNPATRERRLVAAGGLNPENVAEAIATLRPWGVDVVSGVEATPGRKDPAKVRAFIARARAMDRQ